MAFGYWNFKTAAIEAAKVLAETAKKCYPALSGYRNNVKDKMSNNNIKQNAENSMNNVSDMIAKKVEEITKANKRIEEEKKKGKKKAIKCSIIAGSTGVALGAGAGYLFAKKNQIIKSDYVFDEAANKAIEEKTNKEQKTQKKEYGYSIKKFEEFANGYKISTDGTTIIKKRS